MKWLALLLLLSTLTAWADNLEDAYRALDEARYTRARELAEGILAQKPDDPGALFVMGQVYRLGESSLPRASFYLDRARTELNRGYPKGISTSGPWKLDSHILRAQISTAGEIGHYGDELALIDEYDKLYKPKLDYLKGWPLMKLGKVDEARALLKKMLTSDNVEARIIGLNSLGALETESGDDEKAYDYFEQEVKEVKSDPQWRDPVGWTNTAEAASYLLRFERAEELWLEATHHFSDTTYANPWEALAETYADQGRLAEAIAAAKQMQNWRLGEVPYMAALQREDSLTTAGLVLLAGGYDRDALNVFTRLASRPSRATGTSTKATLVEGRMQYFYVEALHMGIERLREEMSWSGPRHWLELFFEKMAREEDFKQASSRASNLLAGDAGIEGLLRPYAANSLCRPWLSSGLWRLFGPGPLGESARAQVKKPLVPREIAYYQAILGETLAVRGWNEEAEKVLTAAVEGLPKPEAMLIVRCQARLAQVLEAQGKHAEALRFYQRIMEVDPSCMRRCDLALPVEISSDGSPVAEAAKGLLGWSPRLQNQADAFKVNLSGNQAQLLAPDGTVLKTITGKEAATPKLTARLLCAAFHDEAFAPLVDMNQTEIYSVDGSNEVRSATSIKGMFLPTP